MDPLGALSELNWSSFTGMESANDEAEFMSRLLGSCPFTNAEDYDPNLGLPSAFWSSHEGDHIAVDDANLRCNGTGMVNSSMQCWSEEDSSKLFCKNYYLGDANTAPLMNGGSIMMDNCTVNEQNLSSSLKLVAENLLEDGFCFGEDMNFDHLGESLLHPSGAVDISSQILQLKRKLEAPEPDEARLDKNRTEQSENPKKKSQASGDGQRNGKRSQSKKNHKPVTTTDQEENNAALNGQSSTSYSSEDDDSNASQEFNGGPSSSSKESSDLNINGKTRASRGSATDPQSLYARRRRERINERLKILQNLVPNGTKVDISTMLEEAVHYVKFLQQQIKLLSSDELWMYAPIAYNGMDIGRHDLKISASQ